MKLDIERWIVIGIAAIGSAGEAVILFHCLVDWYPFKMMTYPSYRFYADIGYAGFALGPASAVGAAYILSRYGTSYIPAVAVMICPAVYWGIFTIASFAYRIDDVRAAKTNFDGTTHAQVQAEFARDVHQLILVGVVIGAATGILARMASVIVGRCRDEHPKT
jgi:hypothetical protein